MPRLGYAGGCLAGFVASQGQGCPVGGVVIIGMTSMQSAASSTPDPLSILNGTAPPTPKAAAEKWRTHIFGRRPRFDTDPPLEGFGLRDIPAEAFTPELMAMENEYGVTPLHMAARLGHIDRVPKELLTEQSLLAEAYSMSPPLAWAVGRLGPDQIPYDHLDQIPLHILESIIRNAYVQNRWERCPLGNLPPDAKARLARRFEMQKEQAALRGHGVTQPAVEAVAPTHNPTTHPTCEGRQRGGASLFSQHDPQ